MSKFNSFSNGTKTVNLANGQAFKENEKLEFLSILLTSFVQEQYYRGENETTNRIKKLIGKIKDKKFLAKCAYFARNKFGMRSISHVVAGEIAKNVKNEKWTKKFFDIVIHRVDDITEILSYYLTNYNKPIPNSLRKGLKTAFNRFDEYQLAKYRSDNKEISLIDAVNLLHPIPNEKNKEALKKLIKNELKSFDTWESELTKAGQTAKTDEEKEEFKKDVWIKLIKERKLGYFALLRNLRNISEQASEVLNDALEMLIDETLIKKSLVLPFRYLTAIKEIEQISGTQKILIALNKAVEISLKNIPIFDGDTLVVLDTSYSMDGRPAEIGSLFSAALVKTNQCDFMNFSDEAYYHTLNPMDSLLTITKNIKFILGGTNFHSIFKTANKAYDRIIILSDMQGWIGCDPPVKDFEVYKKKYNCNPFVYSFDLQGYGTLQFPESKVFCLAGFSEKIFDIMKLLEQDKNALINEIEKIEI